ncbi:MAG: hypothetical protein WD825_01450 [Gemmatimonadaceae bacterium]
MTDRHNDQDEGRGALREQLPRIDAPTSLHGRVHAALRQRGLIRYRRSTSTWGLLAAGAVLCFAAGLFTGRVSSRQAAVAVAPRYALLLYGGSEGDTDAARAARAEEYHRWALSLSGDARFVSGEELGRVVDELPARSLREPVAGFFLIHASSDELATRIARGCPHLKYGGRVVVQTIGS